MTTATIESISPDPWLAQGFYQRAHEFLRDGQSTGLSAAGRQVLLHSAALAACDAVLAINGRQVLGSEGGHVLRLTEAERLLGDGLGDLFERLDDARSMRAEASYNATFVPSAEPDAAAQAVLELVEHAREHLEPRMPDHMSL
jgi:hypothetical protein